MRITDGTVTLRRHEPGDVDDVLATATDPETVRFTTVPRPYARADAERWVGEQAPGLWESGSAFCWAVEADDGGRPRSAGGVDVRRGEVPDVGFATAPWARGRGLTSRAVRLATAFAFEQGLPVVHWTAVAGNLASWRVAHACGFAFHGERPLSVPHRGELRDGWFASLRPGEPARPRTTWWPVAELVGQRVRLRAHTAADLPRMAEACGDPRTRYWLTALPDPYTEDSAREAVSRWRLAESLGQGVTWAVADRDDDRLLGNVGVVGLTSPLNPAGGELGYWAHPDARGRGATTEAVRLVAEHAFTPRAHGGLGRRRLQIGCAWDNTASRRVAERSGFRLVGRTRQEGLQGRGTDAVLGDGAWYERLADDPRP
jgi:[ribosomal protein S5]-alanine N-acetyltransferase